MKKLSDNSTVTPNKQFRNEVGNLRGIQHENIVRLYGCCYEVQRKVIEQNGTHIRVEVPESSDEARGGARGALAPSTDPGHVEPPKPSLKILCIYVLCRRG